MLKPFKRESVGPVARGLEFAASDAHGLIEVCYHAVLGRAPDAKGLATYVDMIRRTPDRETLIAVVRSISMSEEARDFREHHLATRGGAGPR